MKLLAPIRDALLLAGLTLLVVLLHGYHLGVDDQAIYLPAIKRLLDPNLYPHDPEFFLAQTRLTVFDDLVAAVVQFSGAPLDWVLFAGYLLTIFLLLAGGLALARRCFASPAAHWAAVLTLAAVFPLHVTNTRVQMLDPCLHPRGPATALLLFAVVALLDRRKRTLVWLALAAALHPLMAALGAWHLLVLWLGGMARFRVVPGMSLLATAPLGVAATSAWREVLFSRNYFFPLRWTWYEWIGVALPLAPLWWFARRARAEGAAVRARVCGSFFLSTIVGVAGAVVASMVPGLEPLVPLQGMRVLHLAYFVFFLMLGGVLAERVLRDKPLRWAAYFLPLTAAVVIGYSFYFPASPRIEWPGQPIANHWAQAFEWTRQNTPREALFALDPRFIEKSDQHGFRALAERSRLADYNKDRSVAALFPEVSATWRHEWRALEPWPQFTLEDFRRLRDRFGVSWVVVEQPGVEGLECPYENAAVKVCRIP